MDQFSVDINPHHLNFKNWTYFCLCKLECVWMKEQDCLVFVPRRGEKPQPPKKHMLLYLLCLGPFDSGYQKGHKFSFFVFCPRTIMEFLSVFLSSEDIISGLNKWKNTSQVDSGQNCMTVFLTLICCAYVSKLYPMQLSLSPV